MLKQPWPAPMPATWYKRKHDSSDQATFFHFLHAHVLTVGTFCEDRGQHGHPDWSVAMHPHTQQTVMHCVFWYLSIRTSINFFSNLKNISSSVGSDHTARPLLPTCINEPWPPMTLSLVHHCSFLGPLFFCWPFISFSNRTAEDVTGNRMRERGSDTQQRAPGQDSRRGCHREDKASVHGIPTLST